MIIPVKTYLRIWIALLCLLALTTGLAFINMGAFNFPIAMLIGLAKAVLIVLFFMEIKWAKPILHLAVFVGVIWLAICIFLTMNDYLTRHVVHPY